MMRLLAAEGMLTVSTRHPQPKRESTLQSRYHPLNPMPTLQQQFGNIDIYLFDQILRGNIHPGMRVLDAGCGSGRNLVYFLREGY
jgi:ubiquinone/menaquinone biosynthesis C-methylase UbiE